MFSQKDREYLSTNSLQYVAQYPTGTSIRPTSTYIFCADLKIGKKTKCSEKKGIVSASDCRSRHSV